MRSIPKLSFLAQSASVLARLLFLAPRAIRRFQAAHAASTRSAPSTASIASTSSASPSPSSAASLIFYYSQVVWQDVWQRPQELALGLADYLPVVFLSPLQVHRRYDSIPNWRREIRFDRGRGVRVLQPLILPGEYKSALVFRANQRLIWAEACAVLSPDAAILFISNSPFSASLLDRHDWARTAYDLIDDFPGFPWAPPQSRRLEQRWLDRADVILSGTHALYEKHKAVRPDIAYVPSGVRFEMFQRAPGEIPDDLRRLPRPILGFIGTVSDRLDRGLLEALCRAFPEGSVVLIGPVHGSFDSPRGYANLHLLGPRPHQSLPAYVHQFDLALMPFAVNAATQAINPIKTLEYLAAGRIVLSTPVPDVVRFFSSEVILARDRDEFVRLARHWLAADSTALRARAVERARRSSWEQTVRQTAQRLGLVRM
jgi:UDP-galactopyranose mutase